MARTLRSLAAAGRDGFYGGSSAGPSSSWATASTAPRTWRDRWRSGPNRWRCGPSGHDLWTVPPPSQGYLTLAGAWIAEQIGLPADAADPLWPHLIAEAGRAAASTGPSVLFDGADGAALLSPDRLVARAESIDPDRAASPVPPDGAPPAGPVSLSDGDTTHLCAVDADGLGISLTQSNALDFGAHLVAGETGVFLHNRGVGFSLEPGHPAEYGPGRRPTHTLSPALADAPRRLAGADRRHDGGRRPTADPPAVAGPSAARGGGPGHGHRRGPRRARGTGGPAFPPLAGAGAVAAHGGRCAPEAWREGLESRGHHVRVVGAFNPVDVGCSQIISVDTPGDHVPSPAPPIPAVPTATPWALAAPRDHVPDVGRGHPTLVSCWSSMVLPAGSLIQICTVLSPWTARW